MVTLDDQLHELESMAKVELGDRWAKLTGRPVPKVSPSMLRLALAYELQAKELGGLSRKARQRLDESGGTSASRDVRPGMRLAREFGGTVHLVTIGEQNEVLWNDRKWRSLSEVARAIAGTRWSGPAFFGLKQKRNRSSLHSIYARRLTSAYLGSARSKPIGPESTDDIALASLPGGRRWAGGQAPPPEEPASGGRALPAEDRMSLFHVINMTLNVADRNDWQERRGASFTATPLHVGSQALNPGYVRSERLGTSVPPRGFTLGRAMAVSGAAASPNMGYYSRALTTLAMTVFNVRLGWWLPNPARLAEGEAVREEPPFGFLQSWREAASRLSETSGWVYLSDGGHFDNLGLYEMIRRRCAQILVVDAGCDGSFEYDDLHRVLRKIQVDFGIPIDLPASLPGQPGAGEAQRFVIGTIRYSASQEGMPDGRLIILKPTLRGDEPPSLANYRQNSRSGGRSFPHHSTADQFFDETQFESYRVLGWLSADGLPAALPVDCFAPGADLPDLFYPTLSAEEQPKAIETGSPMPSPLTRPDAEPAPDAQRSQPRRADAQGVLDGLIAQAQTYSTGEIVMRTAGAVALVAATGGLAATAGQRIIDSVVPRGDTRSGEITEDRSGDAGAATPADRKDGDEVDTNTTSPGPTGTPTTAPGDDGPRDGPPDSAYFTQKLDAIQAGVDTLVRRGSPGGTTPDPGVAAELALWRGELEKLRNTIPPDQTQTLARIDTKLDEATRRLGQLDPRRNVRGQ